MCGITGFAGRSPDYVPDPGRLRRMCDSIVHRGPDDAGYGVFGPIAAGMRRLSIIDLASGSQPIFNEDGTISVTFNGEIYNYRELRKELEAAGHRFSTQSDTEVLVHGYEEHGDDFLRRLNGMFAFAIVDSVRGRLLLARDHLGIKPLYYAVTGEALIWGSEIKTILASGMLEPTLDADSLIEFLSWEYVPNEGTLFREIRKLPPGHALDLTRDGAVSAPWQFWDVPTAASEPRTEREWFERLDAALTASVRRQLVSDVPLGAFLSGGVDSSLVVAAMGSAETFSIGFDDPSYNELQFSRQVAEHLATNHRTKVIQPHVAGLFDRLMHHMDDPIGDFSIFPTFLVSELAREHVTVSLSGDGGDELFGGYETYLAQEMAGKYTRIPAGIRSLLQSAFDVLPPTRRKKGLINKTKRFLEGAAYPASLGHARWRIFLSDALSMSLLTPEFQQRITKPAGHHITELYDRAGDLEGTQRCLYVDTKSYLPDNCLAKVDKMSMAVSLEVRVPFLDVDLVELAFAMPAQLKLKNGRTKYLLKELAASKIPPACVHRPKEGFSIPIKNWLSGQFKPILDRYTDRALLVSQGVFAPAMVERLKSEHIAGKANHSHILWSIIVFQAWQEMWLHGRQ